jgi:hypothetical protein
VAVNCCRQRSSCIEDIAHHVYRELESVDARDLRCCDLDRLPKVRMPIENGSRHLRISARSRALNQNLN